MSDPRPRRVYNLGDPPSPDAVPMESFDVLVWDTRKAECEFWEWPTHGRRELRFNRSHAGTRGDSDDYILSELLRRGWEPVSCAPFQYGTFIAKEARLWTFRKRVKWLRDGTETSYVGHRVTPTEATQSHERHPEQDW